MYPLKEWPGTITLQQHKLILTRIYQGQPSRMRQIHEFWRWDWSSSVELQGQEQSSSIRTNFEDETNLQALRAKTVIECKAEFWGHGRYVSFSDKDSPWVWSRCLRMRSSFKNEPVSLTLRTRKVLQCKVELQQWSWAWRTESSFKDEVILQGQMEFISCC